MTGKALADGTSRQIKSGRLLCFGLGYSARVLAKRLRGEGWSIAGTSRTPQGVAAIEASGWRGLGFDGLAPSGDIRAAIAAASHVLVSIPPGAVGDPALALHGADIAASPGIGWIGYLSTIGVYGDHRGGWVDEDTPPAPASERGRRRLAAEKAWAALGRASGKRTVIFRLPGIYGPGRSTLDAVRAGTARRIIKDNQVFNRIHVDDIATGVAASMQGLGRHSIYNVSDDAPAPPEEVVAFAARLLGLPEPPAVPFETAELSPMARSFYGESKRVSNRRMKDDLGVTPAYPSYRQGLSAIARIEREQPKK